jgi:hypothetical protein
MPAHNPALMFGAHDYQIVLPRRGAPREVNIRATAAQPPQVGDNFTIGRSGGLYDLVVEEISRLGGGWNARCRISDGQWP